MYEHHAYIHTYINSVSPRRVIAVILVAKINTEGKKQRSHIINPRAPELSANPPSCVCGGGGCGIPLCRATFRPSESLLYLLYADWWCYCASQARLLTPAWTRHTPWRMQILLCARYCFAGVIIFLFDVVCQTLLSSTSLVIYASWPPRAKSKKSDMGIRLSGRGWLPAFIGRVGGANLIIHLSYIIRFNAQKHNVTRDGFVSSRGFWLKNPLKSSFITVQQSKLDYLN